MSPRKKITAAILLSFAGLALLVFAPWKVVITPVSAQKGSKLPNHDPEILREMERVEAEEQHLSATLWAPEALAQRLGRTFEEFWDALNRSSNKLETAQNLQSQTFLLPVFGPAEALALGIETRSPVGQEVVSHAGWQLLLANALTNGWQLAQCEFRHISFDPSTNGQPAKSTFSLSAHLANSRLTNRVALSGELGVTWDKPGALDEITPLLSIDASRLTLQQRSGEPLFKLLQEERITPRGDNHWSDPMLVYDLDQDGFPEIIFAARNLVFRRSTQGEYRRTPLFKREVPFISAAVLGDFDGDGAIDLLCAKHEGVFLLSGSSSGTFETPARLVAKLEPAMQQALVMTCGDIDGDGDLDVFIGQYKEPYDGGSTPAPYFNANDGVPSFLLVNDGKGNFRDATAGSGLQHKRFRRTYSASLVDFDEDGLLDLVVVSDFAGLDLYRGDGAGHFADVTRKWTAEPFAFGMAHTFADFDADGRLDLLIIGMASPAVQRLTHLNLVRPGLEGGAEMRSRMTFGNRLYLGANGNFAAASLGEDMRNSGWAWGCAAADFDNDGYPDVYIGNGLESNSSVQDYEAEYWLHDQHVRSPAGNLYFQGKMARTRLRDYSYGGYEKNRLYLNRGGKSFTEVGWLAGVALEADSRNVVSADLDRDGKMDLVVSTLEIWPEPKQRLFIFRNEMPVTAQWIGFDIGLGNPGHLLRLRTNKGERVQTLTTGDSYRSQSPGTLHFALGTDEEVRELSIKTKKGEQTLVRSPLANRYQTVRPASK